MTPYQIAKTEIGTKEVEGPDNNERIIEYHKCTSLAASDDSVPWCSSFVNWCFYQAGLRGTNSAMARSWLDFGIVTKDPHPGDIVVLSRGLNKTYGHVGFYVKSNALFVWVLGGNQGDEVNIKSYPKIAVLGYRNYARS